MPLILFCILLYPFAEIASLVIMVSAEGLTFTLCWIIASAVLGIVMLRNRQIGLLLSLGAAFKQRQGASLYGMLWSVRYVLAGVLFIIPGVISDVLALILLLPIKGSTINTSNVNFEQTQPTDSGEDIIQGEYTVKDDIAEKK